MKVSCSVVAGSDRTAIGRFVRSYANSAAVLLAVHPGAQVELVAIVNNNDASLAQELRPLCDRVVVRETPWGFAANHNEVLGAVDSDFHIIANDDVLVDDDTLTLLVEAMSETANSDVAVVSPLLRNPDGSLQNSTYSFPTVSTVLLAWLGLRDRLPQALLGALAKVARPGPGTSRFWSHDRDCYVDTLRGAFVMVRMSAVAHVGPMTDICLVGGEETEWHARLRRAGWRILFTPRTAVTHVGRVSTGNRPDLDIEYLKGVVNYFAQHGSRRQFLVTSIGARLKQRVITMRYRRRTGHDLPLYGVALARIRFRQTDRHS